MSRKESEDEIALKIMNEKIGYKSNALKGRLLKVFVVFMVLGILNFIYVYFNLSKIYKTSPYKITNLSTKYPVDDSLICNIVWDRIISEHKESDEALDYSDVERPVIVVYAVKGIIGNGGFHYLFESLLPGDPYYKHTLESFEKIGCPKVVEIIKKALCLFPNCQPPIDDQERIKEFEKVSEEVQDRLDSEFYEESENIIRALAKYIKDNNL